LGWALMAAMLVHAFVDFNYHIPAPAISCFFLLGLATTVSWPERRESWARWVNPLLLVFSLSIGGLTAWQGWQTWAGWRSLPEKPEEAAKLSDSELESSAQKAERWDPRSPNLASILGDAYRLKLLKVYFAPPSGSPSARALRKKDETRLAEEALRWYRAAAQRSPQDDTFGVRQASILDLQGKYAEAEVLYRQGLQQRPHATFFHLSYGNHLWRKGDLLGAKVELEKAVSLGCGETRPGEEKYSGTEAREMLAQLKEQIAKGPAIRQGKRFNPKED
jgi:tetratricopeptide (TPR) repeat protein